MQQHPMLTLAQAEEEQRYRDLEALEAYRKGTGDAPVLYCWGYTKEADPDLPLMDFVASEESKVRLTQTAWLSAVSFR